MLIYFPQFIFTCKKITYKNRAVPSQTLSGHYRFEILRNPCTIFNNSITDIHSCYNGVKSKNISVTKLYLHFLHTDMHACP